ncbi:5'-3' exoribonuclease 1, variant 2 [Balamuthia mandrillaris]
MLALATHEKHFTIFREYVNTGPSQSHRRSWRNRRKFGKPEETFQLLDVPVLRQWIYDEFSPMQPRLSFPFELDRLIDDFILTLFLCGNDFLPNVVSLDIGEGSLDYFFGLYREILPQLQGFITNTIHKEEGAKPDQPLIHFERLSLFLNQLAAIEQEVINKRAKRALQDHNRRKGGLLKKLAYQFKLQQMEAKQVATAPSTTKTSSTASSSELMMELADFIQLSQCECLNNANEDAFRYVLLGDEQGDDKELDESATVIVSDVDPQLIIKIAFKGKAKLSAIAMLGPSGTAPKNVRLYVDKPDLDFEACDDETPTHVLSFAEKDVVEEQEEEEEVALESRRHSLPATKFRSVSHLTIFIEDNQNDGDITKVTQLALYGVPLAGTDLSQLKQRGGASRHRRRGRRGRGGGAASQQGKATLPPLSDANKELVDGLEAQVDHEAQQDNVLLRSLKIPLRFRRYHPEDVEGTGASTTKHDEHVVDFAQYKRNYIQHALSNGKQSEGEGAVVDALLWAYIEGLFWIFEYYYHGCPSWEWFYPYHYGPFASDLANALQESWASEKRKVTFQMGEPLLPLQQLLCVLPPDKVELLPKAYRAMLHPPPSSPLAAFYPPPQHVRVDKNGKKNKWEYVLVLPFIDTKLLLKTLAQSMEESGKELLPEEQERNSFGCVRMLKWRGGGGVEEEQYPWLLSPSLPAAEEHNGQASGGTWQYRRR